MGDRKEPTPVPETPSVRGRSLIVHETELAEAFTEWERRFREDPDRFYSEAHKLLKETPKTYGEACAPYLLDILAKLNPAVDING